MLDVLKKQLEQGAYEDSDSLLVALGQLSTEQQRLLTLVYQLGEDAGFDAAEDDSDDPDNSEAELPIVVVKMNEHGDFDVSATNGGAVRVLLIEQDLCDEANMQVDGVDCIGWETVTEEDPARVQAIWSSYHGR